MTWFEALDRFGFPAIVLAILALALFRFGKWLAPWAEKLFQGHLSMMEHIGASMEKLSDISIVQQASLDRIEKEIKQFAKPDDIKR